MFFKKFFVGVLVLMVTFVASYATNYDLREAKYTIMGTYKAEAFVSNDIYSEDANGKYIERYYTNELYAELVDYSSSSVSSGFNAGLYRLSNGKYILAFGGTTAIKSGDSKIDKIRDSVGDIVSDLNLLNKGHL